MKLENLDQDFNQLILKCIEGNASESEMQQLWAWVELNNENKKYYEHLRDIWISASVNKPMEDQQLENRWQDFKSKNNFVAEKQEESSEPKTLLLRFIRVAAIAIVIFALGAVMGKFYLNDRVPVQSREFYIVEAPRGAKSFVTLADGTKVWLNAGSRISYQRNYNQENRNIFLEGEAYFEVAKNKEIPFYVYSSGIVVKAIGTAFNVKAYPEEGIVETTLVEGSVSIESTGKTGIKEKILMQPNQKASFYKVSKEVVVEDKSVKIQDNEIAPISIKAKIERVELKKEVDTELYTSWKDKRWVFEKQRFEDFAVILERIYDIKVIYKDDELKNYRLSGSLQEENLEQVLQAIQFTIPLDFDIHHREVTVKINHNLKNKYEKLLKMKNN